MSLIVSDTGGSSFAPHPAGQYPATCIDVVDVGWVKTDWGPKYKVRLVFFCGEEETREVEGERRVFPLLVFASFGATLSERGKLRPFLESWRGRAFTGDELGRFDLEKLVGAPAFLQVVHNENGARVYANVKTIMMLPRGMKAPGIPDGFVRTKDKADWTGPAPHPDMESGAPDPEEVHAAISDPDDDLPF